MAIHNSKYVTPQIPPKRTLKDKKSLDSKIVPPQPRPASLIKPALQKIEDVVKPVVKTGKAKTYNIDGKLIHVKVGAPNWDQQLLQTEIEKVQNQVEGLMDENGVDCLVLVTHWAVDIKVIDSARNERRD